MRAAWIVAGRGNIVTGERLKMLLAGIAMLAWLTIATSHLAMAQNTPLTAAAVPDGLPASTVATVNGIAITYDDVSLVEDELMGLVEQLPERKRFETLVGYMVDRILAAEAARKVGLGDDPQVRLRRDFMELKALQDVYVGRQLMQRVTDKEVAAYYKKQIRNGPKREEVRARHIILDNRAAADAVVVALKDGADFATLAKERSKGPTGPNGGDLGYFSKEAMVEVFSEAAFKMKKGKVSAPVKTEFGWHVIKLEDRRFKPTPPLDEMRDQIFQILISEARRDLYDKMRDAADVRFYATAPSTE